MKLIFFIFGLAMALTQCVKSSELPPDPKVIPVITAIPQENKVYPIAIIGAGASGTMAANRAVLNNNEVLVFSGAKQERRRSRGNWVREVDNIPGLGKYQRTVLELRNEVFSDLKTSPLGHNLYIVEDSILSIEKQAEGFKLTDGAGRIYFAKYVVLATGIMDEQPHIQGSIKPILKYANGQTALYCAMCDGHRCYGKNVVVIGHSEQAAKTAHLLSKKYQVSTMTLLTNGNEPESCEGLTVFKAPILEVLGNHDQKQLTGFRLEDGTLVDADTCFIMLGVRPNNELALQLGAEVDSVGYVVADQNGETSIPGFFVIGDLKSGSMKQIYTAWQEAVVTLQQINQRLRLSQ